MPTAHLVSGHLFHRFARLQARHIERLQRLALGRSTFALVHLAELDVHTDERVTVQRGGRFHHRWRVIAS